jgi:hypothetical protein
MMPLIFSPTTGDNFRTARHREPNDEKQDQNATRSDCDSLEETEENKTQVHDPIVRLLETPERDNGGNLTRAPLAFIARNRDLVSAGEGLREAALSSRCLEQN